MAQRIRSHDWKSTPFGNPHYWPQSLRSALSICLNSSYPTAIYWGPDFRLLYNDAWSAILGPRHPDALGKPATEIWTDIWHVVGAQLESVRSTGHGMVTQDQLLPMQRYGTPEETYWDYSFTPIAGEDGNVAGIFNQGQETTERVFAERRARLLLQLGDRIRLLHTPSEIASVTVQTLGEHLGLTRVGWGEVETRERTFRVDACWVSDSTKPLAGRFPLGIMGSLLHEEMVHGEIFTSPDVTDDPRIQGQLGFEFVESYGVRALAAIPVLRNGRYLGLLFAHDDQKREWSTREKLILRSVTERLWQELSRSRSELALRESERRHRLVFEQARDIILTADLDQTLTAVNPAAAEAIGLPVDQIIGRSISEFMAPEEFERTSNMLQQKLAQGGMTRYEVAVRTASGRIRQWDVNSALTIGPEGKPIGLHAVARDVTEKRAFDERQQLLINELNHRVKNTLALVQGLALQSFKGDRTVQEGQEIFQSRLAMLAAAHDLLTREHWEGATIDDLVADAIAPYADRPGRIVTGGPPAVMTPKAAISLALALHELGTNAAKHGALSVPGGSVDLKWEICPDRRFLLNWREKGGPPVTPPPHRGFGLRMIERALANDLEGKVTLTFNPEGLDCAIVATLPEHT